jgi:hypothetical protein
MNDREFIDRFESCTLDSSDFPHRAHVRLAWLFLRELPPLEALARFVTGLQRFAASIGAAGLYHETITWAYLLLIHERMQRAPAADFEEFVAANPDLLAKPSILDAYYRPETLQSELARRVFVLPDALAARGTGEFPAIDEQPT